MEAEAHRQGAVPGVAHLTVQRQGGIVQGESDREPTGVVVLPADVRVRAKIKAGAKHCPGATTLGMIHRPRLRGDQPVNVVAVVRVHVELIGLPLEREAPLAHPARKREEDGVAGQIAGRADVVQARERWQQVYQRAGGADGRRAEGDAVGAQRRHDLCRGARASIAEDIGIVAGKIAPFDGILSHRSCSKASAGRPRGAASSVRFSSRPRSHDKCQHYKE